MTTIEGIISKTKPIRNVTPDGVSTINLYEVPYYDDETPDVISTFILITKKPLSIKESEKIIGGQKGRNQG